MERGLSVSGLRKSYGERQAVDTVSFEVRAGETFGLLGPNGAGKTTTLECILGLREPDAGSIHIDGIDARRSRRDVKRRIGAALQTTALPDKMTPREAIVLFAALSGVSRGPDALLEEFGLLEIAKAPFQTLSGGQRQRLALALALVNNPTLLVLDEPTAGLDANARHDLQARLATLRSQGRTILLTTHDLHEAERLCDRVAIIDGGRIAAVGPPHALATATAAELRVAIRTSEPIDAAWLAETPGIEDVTCDQSSVRFRAGTMELVVSTVLPRIMRAGITVVELHVQTATLEETFLRLTARDVPGTDSK
jgi:ABC-2 type transport system ATP-binding protein